MLDLVDRQGGHRPPLSYVDRLCDWLCSTFHIRCYPIAWAAGSVSETDDVVCWE